MPREQRKFEVDDGSTRQQKHSMGGRASFVVPPGLSLWRPKKNEGASHLIDIIAFHVTQAHLKFPVTKQYSKPGKWYGERTFHVHGGVGINTESHLCLSRNFEKRCPICEAWQDYLKSPSQEAEEEAKAIKPKERQLFLIFDHDEKHKGVQLWEIAYWNFGKHLDRFIQGQRNREKQAAYKQYYHPVNGFTIQLAVSEEVIGKGKPNALYTPTEFTKREESLPDEFWDLGYDLDKMVLDAEKTYDDLKAIFGGSGESDEDSEDREHDREEEQDRSPSSSPPPANNSHPEFRPGVKTEREKKPEPKPKESPRDDGGPYVFASKDLVSFEWKGVETEGEIVAVDLESKMARVKIQGREAPIKMDFSDLKLVKADDTFDLKDSRKAVWDDENGNGDGDGEDDDMPVPPSKKRQK